MGQDVHDLDLYAWKCDLGELDLVVLSSCELIILRSLRSGRCLEIFLLARAYD